MSSLTNDECSALKNYISRIEKLEIDKAEISEEIAKIYSDAKNDGYDTQIMKKVIKLRRLEDDKRRKEEMLLDHYKAILGME